MEHEQYIELMSAALDGEIAPAERQTLDAHLAVCPECAALWQELRTESAALRALDCEVPEELKAHILGSLPAQEKPRRSPWRRWAAACACLVLVAAAALAGPHLLPTAGDTAPEASTSVDGVPQGTPFKEPNFSISGYAGAQKWSADTQESVSGLSLAASFQVDYGSTAPEGVYVLDSEDALAGLLEQFPAGDDRELSLNSDLSSLTEIYDADYFTSNCLAAIVLNDAGGRQPVLESLTCEQAVVSFLQEDRGGDEPAAWLIVTPVDSTFDAEGEIELVCTD